jgi:hypothetical protein
MSHTIIMTCGIYFSVQNPVYFHIHPFHWYLADLTTRQRCDLSRNRASGTTWWQGRLSLGFSTGSCFVLCERYARRLLMIFTRTYRGIFGEWIHPEVLKRRQCRVGIRLLRVLVALQIVGSMLRNYAHHAQSPKSSVHSVHKMQGKVIWQILKRLSDRSSFVEPWLQSHICEGHVDWSFFPWRTINAVYMIGMIAMIGVDQFCVWRRPIGGPIGARIGRISSIYARDCAWSCTCADRPSQFLCMHMWTHAQDGFADSPK